MSTYLECQDACLPDLIIMLAQHQFLQAHNLSPASIAATKQGVLLMSLQRTAVRLCLWLSISEGWRPASFSANKGCLSFTEQSMANYLAQLHLGLTGSHKAGGTPEQPGLLFTEEVGGAGPVIVRHKECVLMRASKCVFNRASLCLYNEHVTVAQTCAPICVPTGAVWALQVVLELRLCEAIFPHRKAEHA